MIRVAIDAATDRLSVALSAGEGAPLERHVVGARRHAAAIIPTLEALLREGGVAGAGAITELVVADGPGSFTGLRVAAAVAKALARAGGVRLMAIPSLLGRAWRAGGPDAGLVLAATSALRGEVYAGWYRLSGGQVLVERAAAPMTARQVAAGERPDRIIGDGPDGLLESLASRWSVPLAARDAGTADARALLAVARTRGAWDLADPARWEPEYGRPAEAQARWEREHGRPLSDPSRSGG